MKEPQKFIGSNRALVECSLIWLYINKLENKIEKYQESQNLMNWIMGIALTLSVSTLLTMIILK